MLLASAPDAIPRRSDGAPAAPSRPIELAQVTIEQRVIIRIPTVPVRPARTNAMDERAPAPPIRWKESKGPKCLPLNRIRGAVITATSGVTMVTGRDEQFRAHFGRACRPADFYSGFYIQPSKDGSLCAGRDTLHARNGSACEIEKFSKMTAEMEAPEPPERPVRPDR